MRILDPCGLMVALLAMAIGCGNEGAQPGTSGASAGTGGIGTGGAVVANGGTTGASVTGGAGSGGTQVTSGGSVGQGGTTTGASTGGATSTGGQSTTGGVSTFGGATATGGKSATGGTATNGGSTTNGGAATTGGSKATAGQSNAGGNATTGGATATGGKASTGGTTTTGGATATGGKANTGGTTTTGGVSGTYKPCPTDGSACKIMPFGDSITDGYNSNTPGGYRVELFRLAHSAGKNITFVGTNSNGPATVDGVTFPPKHEGHSGWTISTCGGRSPLAPLVATVMPQFTPHIVLLMIGTNDCIDNCDLANAPNRLGALIDSIYAQLPNILIVVGQPPPSRGDSSQGDDTGLSARIKTYNDAIPAVVKTRADAGKHILVVDMYTPFTANKAALMADQWHPNLAGYVIIGTGWYSTIQSLL